MVYGHFANQYIKTEEFFNEDIQKCVTILEALVLLASTKTLVCWYVTYFLNILPL